MERENVERYGSHEEQTHKNPLQREEYKVSLSLK
jgi:hypothetical protein